MTPNSVPRLTLTSDPFLRRPAMPPVSAPTPAPIARPFPPPAIAPIIAPPPAPPPINFALRWLVLLAVTVPSLLLLPPELDRSVKEPLIALRYPFGKRTDVNCTSRVAGLPFLAARDTFVTLPAIVLPCGISSTPQRGREGIAHPGPFRI